MDENAFVSLARELFAPGRLLPPESVAIGDDCAVLPWDGEHDLLLTCDTLVEGTHFLPGTAPELVARKLLAVNVSDVAAMAGLPWVAALSLTVPRNLPAGWLEAFSAALAAGAKDCGLAIVGGDTVGGPCLSLSLTLLGRTEKGRALLRSTARPGEGLYVTGPLGGSFKSGRHLTFTPRLHEARWLRDHLAVGAMMDLSDGLAEDGRRLAAASGVLLNLEGSALPLNPGCTREEALQDGEDFELLLTLPELPAPLAAEFRETFGLELRRVGTADRPGDAGPGLLLDGAPLELAGYSHF